MADVDDIIYYIKSLKRGFDKDLYESKINHLAYIAETHGLGNDDLHTLFKIWLNLSIPLAKWTCLGSCLVPQDIIEERTVDYALCWIMASKDNPVNLPKIAYLLDWLTAAMDVNCILREALDSGYEIFYSLMHYEILAIHVIKLLYSLTKPVDVTRKRVTEILNYIKIRDAKKNWIRQLQVMLGLFKSYKPEFVPEDVPAISIHTAFKKINGELLRRFQTVQDRRNGMNRQDKHPILWMNPVNSKGNTNKKSDPLVPNIEILKIGSLQYNKGKLEKTYLDFTDPTALVQYSLYHNMSRPAKFRALLCNETGITLLSVMSSSEYSFFMHDLYHLLNTCFLEISPYTYVEKQDLLQRLVVLQRTLMQGLPVITRFLAQFLPLWNERDYFDQILGLIEWLSVDNPNQVPYITKPLTQIYHRAEPMEQCAITRSLTNAYCNLVYSSSRTRYNLIHLNIPQENYTIVQRRLAVDISVMCDKGLQANPDDIRILLTSVRSAECRTMAEICCGVSLGALPGRLTLALPIVSNSAHLLDKMAGLMILYKKLLKKSKNQNVDCNMEHLEILKCFTEDMINCLYKEQAFSERERGMIFNKLQTHLVDKLTQIIPDIDNKFSLRNNLAFMPYAPLRLESDNNKILDNNYWFTMVIEKMFNSLAIFLKIVVSELRNPSSS